MSPAADVVFFDPFETLGSEVAGSRENRLANFLVYPSARRILNGLRERARLGVISLDPDVAAARLREVLGSNGLIPPIEPDLVFVAERDEADPFARVLGALPHAAGRSVFVSLDASHRMRARAAGLGVAPHAGLAAAVLASESLHFVRLFAPESEDHPQWASLLAEHPVVPVFRTRDPEPALYTIASRPALGALAESPFFGGIQISILGPPDVPSVTTLFLIQLPPEQAALGNQTQSFIDSLDQAHLPLVSKTPAGWLVALPGDRSPDELHPPPGAAGHGHTRVLLPDPSLLKKPERRVEFAPGSLRSGNPSRFEALNGKAFRQRAEAWLRADRPRGHEEPQP